MGIEYNALTVNGKSTADLPFFCGVTENSAPTLAERKDKFYDLDMVNGLVKQTINAYKSVVKQYDFYLHDVTLSDVRKFKAFIGHSGWFTPYDDPDIHYNYLKAVFESERIDEFNGYIVTVTFTCESFEYEKEISGTLGASITNHTTAPMYPQLKLYGQTNTQQSLTIGGQTMVFTQGIDAYVIVECKHGLQDVKNKLGNSINSQIRGPFFEIQPGNNTVTRSSGITSIEIINRWGWL